MKSHLHKAGAVSVMLLAASLTPNAAAFLIGKHASITQNALARLPGTARTLERRPGQVDQGLD